MTTSEGPWAGRLMFGPWWLVYTGLVGPTEPHRHHAAQVLLAHGSRIVDDTGEHPSPTAVAPDHTHAIAGSGSGCIVFLDPEGPRVAEMLTDTSTAVPTAFQGLTPATLAEAEQLVTSVTSPYEPVTNRALHPATQAALDVLADRPDTPLATLATEAHLSPSRLSHLFRAEVGLPVRSYRRWARFLLAADALRTGATLSDAAHSAGFADAAHLHRTFRDQFGLRPRELLRSVEWVTT
jgi:AraC-like DNA-binding protein